MNKRFHLKYDYPKQNELLYVIALFFEILAMIIDLSTIKNTYSFIDFNTITKTLRYIGYVIIFIKIINTAYTKDELLLQIAVVAVVGANALVIGRSQFLAFMFVYGMKDLDFEYVVKRICIWINVAMILTILLAYAGVIQNWTYSIGNRMRASLGYRYPSVTTSVILYAWTTLCYVLKNKLKLWHVIVMELLNIVQYQITDSRTGTAIIALMLVVFYLIRYFKDKKIDLYFRRILVHAVWISAAVSIACVLFYNPDIQLWAILNKFVSNRIVLSVQAIQKYGIHLFGMSIQWIGFGGLGYLYDALPGEYNFVDCSYIKILLDNGIVFFLMIIAGFTYVSSRAAKKGNTYFCLALAVVAVYSMIEPRLCQMDYNPFLLTLGTAIELKRQKNEENSSEYQTVINQ